MIRNKIDIQLQKALTLDTCEKSINCLVYVSNLDNAAERLKKYNIVVDDHFPIISALSVNVPSHLIGKLAKENFVQYIVGQSKVETLMHIAKKVLNVNNYAQNKNQLAIAYIDTGISKHLDFCVPKNRIIKFVDVVNGYETPYDDNGHGTFVSGVGSGSGMVSGGKFSGIAPHSNIVSIKALNDKGEANATKILEAMQWLYDNANKYKIKVVCMSFGSEPLGFNDPIMKGAEVLWKRGVVIVSAAGNSGPNYETIKSPGISSKIITVGGLNDNRFDGDYKETFFEIANFSSRGPALNRFKPDIIAPAVDINSCCKDGEYITLSGTSVATPMIAGLCFLAYNFNTYIKPDYIKRALILSAKGITFNKNLEGFGLPNAEIFLNYFK